MNNIGTSVRNMNCGHQKSSESLGIPCNPLETPRIPCNPLESLGNPRNLLESLPKENLESPRITGNPPETLTIPGNPWNPIYGVSRNPKILETSYTILGVSNPSIVQDICMEPYSALNSSLNFCPGMATAGVCGLGGLPVPSFFPIYRCSLSPKYHFLKIAYFQV